MKFAPYPPSSNYAKIPNGLYKHMRPIESAIYLYIADKKEGWDFAGSRIANDMGLAVNTVDKYLKSLVEKGFLIRTQNKRNRKMTYELYYIPDNYEESIFDQCKHFKNDSAYNAFSIYLEQHDKQYKQKHIHLKNEQIIKDCDIVQQALDQHLIDNSSYRMYVQSFLTKKGSGTDYHFPAFVNFLLGEIEGNYRGFNSSGEALSKDDRLDMIML